MILCDYCANPSTSNQVCTECGEPLVDNPNLEDAIIDHRLKMDWLDELAEREASELTEWLDFDPDC